MKICKWCGKINVWLDNLNHCKDCCDMAKIAFDKLKG